MARIVTITEDGRSGTVRYVDGAREISGWWEFGAGDVIAIVSMGTLDEWRRDYPWAVDARSSILRFVASETIRLRAPSCAAEIDDERGGILLRQTGKTVAPVAAQSRVKAASFVRRYGDIRAMFALAVLVVVLAAGAIAYLGKASFRAARPPGVPVNESVRYEATDASQPGGIATLIRSTDPHLPNWSGRGGGETYALGIVLMPLDGAAPRLIPVASGLRSNGFMLARILGSDGRTVWFDVGGLYGVRLASDTILSPAQLRAANPALDPSWWDDPRGMDIVDGRLHIARRDRSAALDVDPATLTGTPVPPKPSKARFQSRRAENVSSAGPIRLAGSGAALTFGTSAPGLRGTVTIARVDAAGTVEWTADTGLDRFELQQILPGTDVVAFIGTRPPVPGKLSEPFVVMVDVATGKMTSHSLWR